MLKGEDPPVAKEDSVRATVRALGLDGVAFERIFELRGGKGAALTQAEGDSLFATYMEQIERVIEAVDRIEA
jgi:hypothetical protein